MKNHVNILMLFLLFLAKGLDGQILNFDKIKWETEKVAPGLVWKYSHTLINDTFPQNINILIVNLYKRRIQLLYDEKKNIIVSKQSSDAGAIAAVNGGFFNIKEGGSATYIRNKGLIVDEDTAKDYPDHTRWEN